MHSNLNMQKQYSLSLTSDLSGWAFKF